MTSESKFGSRIPFCYLYNEIIFKHWAKLGPNLVKAQKSTTLKLEKKTKAIVTKINLLQYRGEACIS